jgi:hypothetical protein
MQNLATEVRAWTQRFHSNTKIWAKVPEPILIPDRHHLLRQIRYVHLNPCRAGLAPDPLSWEWSTHRDFTGCVINPWPSITRLATELKVDRHRFGNWFHAYASKDPSVAIAGTPPIREYKKGEPLLAATAHVWKASAVSLRASAKIQRGPVRSLAIQTCGFLQLPQDPEYLKISPRHLKLTQQEPKDLSAIQMVLKILLDPRTRPSVH